MDWIEKLARDHGTGGWQTLADMKRFGEAVASAERDRICAAIKAEDDHCADGDYMMDSDDCIRVVRGTWVRPDWNCSNAELWGAKPIGEASRSNAELGEEG